jgi:putative aldouronate transport system permease protein
MAKHKSALQYDTPGEKVFNVFNVLLLILLCFITAYPVYYVFCASFSDNVKLLQNPGFMLLPQGWNTAAYRLAFTHPLLVSGYKNILTVMAIALPLNILLTLLCGYFLASRNVMFKKPIMVVIMITMFFNGGMIPNFLNIQSLGLYNTLWALILPGAISIYNSIICKTAIEAIPDSLSESAYIDGANDLIVLFRIVFPLITPTIAVLLLYYGVAHWNSWFSASIYIKDNMNLPIQNVLRGVLIANSNILNSAVSEDDRINQFAETIKYAAIVISTVPVLLAHSR